MSNKKVHLSLTEEDVAKFDLLREELGMNRSQYVSYLLSGEKKRIPDSIRQKHLISKMSDIDLHLRHICLKVSIVRAYVDMTLKNSLKPLNLAV